MARQYRQGARAAETERIIAEDLNSSIFPGAYAPGKSLPGKDILRTPGWSIEVKASRDGTLLGGLRQAVKNAAPGDDYGCVIWRPDGYGKARLDEWVVAMPYADWKLLVAKDTQDDS